MVPRLKRYPESNQPDRNLEIRQPGAMPVKLRMVVSICPTPKSCLHLILSGHVAAAVLLMKRSKAIELGQPILGKFCGAVVAGVPPRIMGTGPAVAIPKLLEQFRLNFEDVDLFEINEAFASMAIYCLDKLELDHGKVNVRGGAIALGHPLGATGARQICTILSEARRTQKRILVTSMCIGTGQGMAGLLVNEQI